MREGLRIASYKGLQKNLFSIATNDTSYYHRVYAHKYSFDIFYQQAYKNVKYVARVDEISKSGTI
jgi:hypothetical protein